MPFKYYMKYGGGVYKEIYEAKPGSTKKGIEFDSCGSYSYDKAGHYSHKFNMSSQDLQTFTA